jgi:hypothetical protein
MPSPFGTNENGRLGAGQSFQGIREHAFHFPCIDYVTTRTPTSTRKTAGEWFYFARAKQSVLPSIPRKRAITAATGDCSKLNLYNDGSLLLRFSLVSEPATLFSRAQLWIYCTTDKTVWLDSLLLKVK